MTLYFFAFLSGLVTIFAPCIWPLLPIILSVGATGKKQKPLGIIVGLSVSFLFFTLALASLLQVVPVDPEVFRVLGIIIILFFGITLLIPKFTVLLEGVVSRLSSRFGALAGNRGSGFAGGVATGAALGVVWSPCAGPILATVATVAATQGVSLVVFLIAFFFVLGVSVPLFLIALLGQKAFARMRGANKYTARIQQVFGVIIILTAIMIYTGYDKTLQAKILAACGIEEGLFASFENSNLITEKLAELRGGQKKEQLGALVTGSSLKDYGKASDFRGITGWLNTEENKPLSLDGELKGKVVLIDFWTYSCINCIRTLPYVKSWHEKYSKNGFSVVGVHTPEFLFEHKAENVREAIAKYRLPYPVAQDNDYATWEAYQNRYWPAHYLIDVEGRIRYIHFGEGQYEETEKAIQTLLQEAGQKTDGGFVSVEAEAEGSGKQTRETYLGLARMERFQATPKPTALGEQYFTFPASLPLHGWGYEGAWKLEQERSEALPGAKLRFHVKAKKVFLVMGPRNSKAEAEVWLNGERIQKAAGKDVQNGSVSVTEERLYELVDFGSIEEAEVELRFPEGNIAVYAFTFS